MKTINRRDFMGRTGKIVAGAVAISALSYSRVLGANERVNMALIGCGGRGRGVMNGMVENGAQMVCACDVNKNHRENTAKEFSKSKNIDVKTEIEMRKVFEDKDIDAVLVSTPEHWHALATIWACQAGKDVYVEKNPTISIWEGRKMVEAAEKYNRVVQIGFQNRSAPYGFSAREYIRSGKLGKVVHVKSYNLLGGSKWMPQPDNSVPEGLDWDRWIGPAKKVNYNPGRHSMTGRGGWGSFWDYSGGTLADDASHVLDLARMVLDDPSHPKSVYHAGGNLAFGSERETPEMQCITYDFGDYTWTCESSNFPPYMKKSQQDVRYGNKFPDWRQNATRTEIYGTKAMMYLGRHGGGWQVMEGDGKVVEFEYGYFPDREHQLNFIDSVKTRKQPNGNVEQGQISATMVHLGNISYRVGNQLLFFNPKTETFTNSDQANELLKPHCRENYRIPDPV